MTEYPVKGEIICCLTCGKELFRVTRDVTAEDLVGPGNMEILNKDWELKTGDPMDCFYCGEPAIVEGQD